MDQSNNVVTINVGGRLFTTRLSTLTKVAYFENLFGKNFKRFDKDYQGHIFIDRDPEYFNYVLNYLRGDTLELENENAFRLDRIKAEFDFFNIDVNIEHQQVPADSKTTKDYMIVNTSQGAITSFYTTEPLTQQLFNDLNFSNFTRDPIIINYYSNRNDAALIKIITLRTGYRFLQRTLNADREMETIFVKE